MCMLQPGPRNSNQWTTQGGWRYTPCGTKICSRTYIGFAVTCPIPTSSGTVRTRRTRSSRTLMQRKLGHYARHAYMEKTDKHRPTDTVYIGHYQQYKGNALRWMRLHVGTYCDVMRDGASQMICCNFTKSQGAEDVVQAFTKLWNLNPSWKVFDHRQPDHKNLRFIQMDSETSYKSAEIRTYFSDIGYKIEHTLPRDKHAGGIAERTVGLLTGKTNTAIMENTAPKSMWCWAMSKASQDLNSNYNEKIKTSPYHFVTGQHIDMKYLHSFFCRMLHVHPSQGS